MKELKYSVIIPTFNRVDNLNTCLNYLRQVDPPKFDWEIIVVDNGSTDNTSDVVKNFQIQNKRIKYLYEGRPGQHIAWNTGCEEAVGEILCYIDDDSFVQPTWLKAIEESFSDPEVVLVGGPCVPLYEDKPPVWLEYFWSVDRNGKVLHQLSLIDLGHKKKIIDPMLVFGCNFSIRKEYYIRVGGSAPDIMPPCKEMFQGEGESAVARMISNLGFKAMYSPEAKIQHLVSKSRMTLDYFLHNARYKGIGKSFTELRMKNKIENYSSSQNHYTVWSKIGYSIKRLRIYIGSQRRLLPIGQPKYVAKIKRDVYNEMMRSYRKHQIEAGRNPKLMEWILRKNYFGKNGELPELQKQVN